MPTRLVMVREDNTLTPYIFQNQEAQYHLRRAPGRASWELVRFRHVEGATGQVMRRWGHSKNRNRMIGEALTAMLEDGREEGGNA